MRLGLDGQAAHVDAGLALLEGHEVADLAGRGVVEPHRGRGLSHRPMVSARRGGSDRAAQPVVRAAQAVLAGQNREGRPSPGHHVPHESSPDRDRRTGSRSDDTASACPRTGRHRVTDRVRRSAPENPSELSYAQWLWSHRTAYAGDGSRVAALVRGVGPAPEGSYRIRLHTAKRRLTALDHRHQTARQAVRRAPTSTTADDAPARAWSANRRATVSVTSGAGSYSVTTAPSSSPRARVRREASWAETDARLDAYAATPARRLTPDDAAQPAVKSTVCQPVAPSGTTSLRTAVWV